MAKLAIWDANLKNRTETFCGTPKLTRWAFRGKNRAQRGRVDGGFAMTNSRKGWAPVRVLETSGF